VGKLLMETIFTVEPAALDLYSFRDVPNLYESLELKAHYTKLVGGIDSAVKSL